jgi:hypothetical protein
MGTHTHTLWQLTTELVAALDLGTLRAIAQASPFEYNALVTFDQQLGGPSMGILSANNSGRYEVADREVFRPLQYCSMFLEADSPTREWTARETVHMAGLHLESLIKRVGQVGPVPLGAALRHILVRPKLDPVLWQQMVRFAKVYNAAKHNVNHPKDTHLFSVEDAVLAFIVARQLAMQLYPLVKLKTELVALAAA